MSDPILAIAFPLGGHSPVDPGFGRPGHRPVDPGFGGNDPGHPWLPGHGGGMNGGHIDNSLPVPPLPPALNPPPDQIYPPVAPIFPGTPDHPIEAPPGSVWPPLPPSAEGELILVLCYITGHGWHWAVLDPQALPPDAATKPITPPPAQPK